MKKILALCLLGLSTKISAAEKLADATIFLYDEKETGTDISRVRYVLTDDYMRIDEGRAEDDYILYDVKKNILYNINHDDRTIMFIESKAWKMPTHLARQVIDKKLPEAPKIAGKEVAQYHLIANDKICSEVQFIPDIYEAERAILSRYQNLLSGQLVSTLHNTPLEMQTDCMLVDRVYRNGELYNKGLPIQEQHENGYIKILVDFSKQKVDKNLFTLPALYEKYQPLSLPNQNQ